MRRRAGPVQNGDGCFGLVNGIVTQGVGAL